MCRLHKIKWNLLFVTSSYILREDYMFYAQLHTYTHTHSYTQMNEGMYLDILCAKIYIEKPFFSSSFVSKS